MCVNTDFFIFDDHKWVNGVEAVRHSGGYLPFEGEVSASLKFGRRNRITVAVNNTLTPWTIPQGGVDKRERERERERVLWSPSVSVTVEFGYIIHGIDHPAAYIGHLRSEPNFDLIKSPGTSSSPPVISATLRGARGNTGALRAAQIALIAGVAA